jgi:hypothetical protein
MPLFRQTRTFFFCLILWAIWAAPASAQTDTLRQRARGGKPSLSDTARRVPLGPLPTAGDTTGGQLPAGIGTVLDTPAAPRKKVHKHSPLRAAIFAAAIPGAGQIYNRKYWKAPIAWAIIGGTGYWMFSSRSQYRYWRFQYLYRVDADPLTMDENPSLPTGTLKAQRDQSHSAHELSIIAFAVGYILTVTDAFVDAHLFDFDVSDDLSLRLVPGQPAWAATPFGIGATVQIRF